MPDTKISAAADAGTLLATDMLPLARSGSTTAYHATMAEVGVFAGTNLPVASTTTLGGVKIDGSTISIASGVISATAAPYSSVPAMDGTGAAGASALFSRGDHVHPSDTTKAPLASPALTGSPTAPTKTPATDSSTAIATTAFVQSAMAAAGAGVSSWNTRTGAVVLALSDVTAVGGAPLASPTFTGTVTIPSGANIAGYAPLAAPVFTGDARAVTPAYADNDTSIATTAFVQTAVAIVANVNAVDNAGFAVNQRGYVSGTALAASAYGHDRWKAGASGCTYTFSAPAGPINTITITAGSLQQVIEGAALAGGNYTLSWTGTAQGRVGAGSYAASPVVAATTAGTNATIEFNAGTVGQVKFERGALQTAWIGRSPADDLKLCQRFYYVGQLIGGGTMTTGQTLYVPGSVPVSMRATPTMAVTNSGSSAGLSSIAVSPLTPRDFYGSGSATATQGVLLYVNYTASADL